MDQVEGVLEDMYKEEVGDRSTPDNPRHPSIGTRRPAGGMGTDPRENPPDPMQCLTWGRADKGPGRR